MLRQMFPPCARAGKRAPAYAAAPWVRAAAPATLPHPVLG
jgi:hypothetical protein